MRLRLVAVSAAAVAVLTAVTGCSSSTVPASPLNGSSALTCPGRSRGCAAPGTVRWSVPLLPGMPFLSSGRALLNLPAAVADNDPALALIGGGYLDLLGDGYLASVVVAPGLVVFQQPGRSIIEAIDPATGKRRWSTRLAVPPGFSWPPGSVVLTLAAAGGLITAYDKTGYLWWVVNAATGAASPPQRLPGQGVTDAGAEPLDVLPVTPRTVALVNDRQIQGVDPVTGSARWRVRVQHWTGYALIGHVLYLDNTPLKSGKAATAIQRVDLASGRALPRLPLPASLHAESVLQFSEDPGALLVQGFSSLERVNPATGRAEWVRALRAWTTPGPPLPGPAGSPPTVEYLVPRSMSHLFQRGMATKISQVITVNLTTGSASAVTIGRSVTYGDAGIDPGTFLSGWGWDNWNLYGPVILSATAIQPAGAGGLIYTRLDGVNPATGHIMWRGPWAGDLYVLGETFTGPPVIIAQSCAPSGLAADPQLLPDQDARCNSGRLYAINV